MFKIYFVIIVLDFFIFVLELISLQITKRYHPVLSNLIIIIVYYICALPLQNRTDLMLLPCLGMGFFHFILFVTSAHFVNDIPWVLSNVYVLYF